MNGDASFDCISLRATCKEEQIEANIKTNLYNKTTENMHVYFDELLYKRRTKIEHDNVWMLSKHCSSTLKQRFLRGWFLLSDFVEN